MDTWIHLLSIVWWCAHDDKWTHKDTWRRLWLTSSYLKSCFWYESTTFHVDSLFQSLVILLTTWHCPFQRYGLHFNTQHCQYIIFDHFYKQIIILEAMQSANQGNEFLSSMSNKRICNKIFLFSFKFFAFVKKVIHKKKRKKKG